jgi:hypothetical protein
MRNQVQKGEVMKNSLFASSNLTAGQLNAIVKKLGGDGAARRFLQDEIGISIPLL